MSIEYSWESRLFSDRCNILKNYKRIGFIKSPFFSRKATAEIDGKKYEFRNSKWYNPKMAEISDASGNVIGKIKYDFDEVNNNVKESKDFAYIKINDDISTWESCRADRDWKLYNPTGLNITYTQFSFFGTRGKIVANKENGIKLLSGLYVMEFFGRGSALFLAGIPIFIGFLVVVFIKFLLPIILDILRWIF